MSKINEDILKQKAEIYELLSLTFMDRPSKAFSEALSTILNEEYFPLREYSNDLEELKANLAEKLNAIDDVEFAVKFDAEYYDLFFDPHGIKVSPWHSSYTNREHLLFQKPDFDTKKTYLKYGYKVTDNHLPGDHIAIELDFLKRITDREIKSQAENELEKLAALLKDNAEFIEEHVLTWIDDFIESLRQCKSEYYLLFASMIKVACELDFGICTKN